MTDVHRCKLPLSAGVSLESDSVTKKKERTSKFPCSIHSTQFRVDPSLVGGFNPVEKYYSNRIISPGRDENQ